MRIAQISDSHITLPGAVRHDRLADLRAYVDHVNAIEPAVDLVVHTGDVTHHSLEEEAVLAKAELDRLKAPYFVIPGNKDERQTLRAVFGRHIGAGGHPEFVQFSVDGNGLALIMLDTKSDKGNKGALCPQRLQHFRDMLKTAADRPVAIFMHHPPVAVTAAPDPFQFNSREEAEAFAAVVADYPNIRHIAAGHMHRVGETEIAGVRTVTVQCMAQDLRKGDPVPVNEICRVFDFRVTVTI